MNIEFFLKERIKFIRYCYSNASTPFSKIMTDIEKETEPFVPSYSEDEEPPYLSEWLDAKSGLDTIGHHVLSMLSSSLQL